MNREPTPETEEGLVQQLSHALVNVAKKEDEENNISDVQAFER